MSRNIQVRSIKRREIDSDKLALAFLMLAKILHDQERPARSTDSEALQLPAEDTGKSEAA